MTRLLTLILVLAFSSGPNFAQEPGFSKDPVQNFEFAWKTLDRTYCFFEHKHVDWDAIYHVYRPQVSSNTTPSELLDVLVRMFGHLNDGHVAIECNDGQGRVQTNGVDMSLRGNDFSLNLVKSTYLHDSVATDLNETFTFGWLTDKIAYLHIGDFKQGKQATPKAIDSVIENFSDAKGFIVDVRLHPGGNGSVANAVANRFADRPRHYMTSWTRYGKLHSDFVAPTYWNVEPDGPVQFTRNTIVLSHRFTESAGDDFVLAMRVLPHVTVVGDMTAGALGSQYPVAMPNGWTLFLPFKANLDPNDMSWDGIGLAPDLRIVNRKVDIESGTDRVLELAIELLQHGKLKPQDESSSLRNIKVSLVKTFERTVKEKGLDTAIAEMERLRSSGNEQFFLSPDEIVILVQQYAAQNQFNEAVAILEVCVDEFPNFKGGYGMLAFCLLQVGNKDRARSIVSKAESMETMYSWEEPHLAWAKRQLKKES